MESDVFWSTTRYSFPHEPIFSFPAGIIASCVEVAQDDELDANDISTGYRRTKDNEGLIEIGINVERLELFPLYERLLKLRSSYEAFWYLLHDHWDDKPQEFLTTEALNSPDSILSHLRDHEHDSVLNGFVTLTSFLEEGATNLNISDHKRIVILTYSDEMALDYEEVLASNGVFKNDELVSFDQRVHHRHYRPTESLDRKALVCYLRNNGFSPWKPNE